MNGVRSNNGLQRTVRYAAPPLKRSVNATGLRAALQRCDLGAELPHLAG